MTHLPADGPAGGVDTVAAGLTLVSCLQPVVIPVINKAEAIKRICSCLFISYVFAKVVPCPGYQEIKEAEQEGNRDESRKNGTETDGIRSSVALYYYPGDSFYALALGVEQSKGKSCSLLM